jgi:hypothetical protein
VKQTLAIVVSAAVLGSGAAAYAKLARIHGPMAGSARPWPGIVVTGNVSGLYPGSSRRLPLAVRNLLSQRVVLRWLSVTVGQPSAGCPARTLRGGRYPVRLTIPARATRTISVALRMAPGAPAACRGARFPLTYQVSTTPGR